MLIHIQDDIIRLQHCGLLDRMLRDKTTKNNIMWATDAYAHYGHDYERNEEIHSHLITGENIDIIKTRARKEFEQQNQRTRKRAEVFTPMWICRFMIDKADEEWFGYPDVFFKGEEPVDEIRFFEKRHTWQKYVDSKRLEITCGEAPYLMSRYDVATGEIVPIEKRCGILDRKLRVVGENTFDEDEWFTWAIRALQATYGYEFQGDNLLIARINMLCTFEDYLKQRWKRTLTQKEKEKIINIITWNIWQMDGLKYTIPFREAQPDFVQLSLFCDFDEDITKGTQPKCRIFDWRARKSGTFIGIKEGENNMKFDFIIGNPPYQEEQEGDNKTYAPPIYNLFLDNAYEVADKVEMIHPARFLFNAGSTPKAWNKKMLNDEHLKVLHYEPNCKEIFPNTDIKGGIAITYHDLSKHYEPIGTFTPFAKLNVILNKVRTHNAFSSLSSIVITRTAYRLTDKLHKDYPDAIMQLSNGHAYDMSTNIFERLPQVFYIEKPDDGFDYISILGREGSNRVFKYIRADYVNRVRNLFNFKICLPKANGAGKYGESLTMPIVLSPGVGNTETFITIGIFDNSSEAENALKYIKTKFARALLGILKTTQDITPEKFTYVPLQDFTPNSDIDWTKSVADIDRQLYAKYGLDEAEIEFIETHVKEME